MPSSILLRFTALPGFKLVSGGSEKDFGGFYINGLKTLVVGYDNNISLILNQE